MKKDNIDIEATVESKPRRKGRLGRYIRRGLCVLVALVVLAVTVVVAWLGPIAEWYIERNDMELVGRRVEMDELHIKLFKGSVDVDNIVVYEADGGAEFVRAEHLAATMALADIFDKHIHVTGVKLCNPHVAILQEGDTFNFDTLVAYILDEYFDDVEDVDDDEPWRVTIENVAVEGGNLAYHDSEIEQSWLLTMLDIATEEVILGDSYTLFTVGTNINESATVAGELELNCESFDFRFDGTMEGFNLADTYKYWTPYLNIRSVDGIAAADVVLEGNVMDIFAMDIEGEVSAEGLAIVNAEGGNVFSATRLDASIAELNIDKERYIFNTLKAEGYATEMHFRRDGTTNFDGLLYSAPEVSVETTTTAVGDDMYEVEERVTITTNDDEAPLRNMVLRIAKLDLQGGKLDYSDRTMHEDFEYTLRNIAITCDNFDLWSVNKLTLRAQLPKQGSALFLWEGSLTDFYNQSLLAMLTNVDIKGLSPYVEHFTAFPVLSGNMTFRSQNIVTNGKLSGVNQLGTYNFALGKKNRSLKAEYNLPLKFGIFVLTDKDDHIDVDFPITGSIDSPEFSYRRIIMRAIGNMLLKIVAAPFAWMSGDKQEAFRHIDVDLLTPGLDSEHYARLDKMAEALREDGNLKVRLTQRVNYDRAVQRIADLNLKIAYYNATQGDENGYLDMLDFTRIRDVKLSGRAVKAFADSMLLGRGIDPSNMTSHAKAKALYGDEAGAQLGDLMRHRNRIITEYIKFQHSDVAEEMLAINDVVIEDMKNYKGKDRYTVTIIIDDEEIEMQSSVDEEAIDEDYYDAYVLEDDAEGIDFAGESAEIATDDASQQSVSIVEVAEATETTEATEAIEATEVVESTETEEPTEFTNQ
ncbi:MAG: DUF748 domain-containing protein [Alistipes sp.]|nr:DUF748 domain-containing protein [Alistipes sp.]